MAERRIAILDDYQKVASHYADWSSLPADCVVELFDTPLGDETTTAGVLEPFEIICAMRERTPFPRSLLDRLYAKPGEKAVKRFFDFLVPISLNLICVIFQVQQHAGSFGPSHRLDGARPIYPNRRCAEFFEILKPISDESAYAG